MRAAALTLMLCCGCISKQDPPGTLPGEALAVLQLDNARVQSTSVNTDGSPSERDGVLTTVRGSLGAFADFTRFGTMSGIVGSVALGWLSGDAASLAEGTPQTQFYADIELGGMVQPLFIAPGGRAIFSLAGDFGVGISRDERYGYAGGKIALGAYSRSFVLDLGFRRRFYETANNPGAHEDHSRAIVSLRPGKGRKYTLHIGFEYIRGDNRSLDEFGMEVAHDEDLLRGRYQMLSVILGFGAGAPRPTREPPAEK